MKRLHSMLVAGFALAAIALLAWWAYAPGFSGGFLFDDYANLPALGATGPVDDWATFWRYLSSGTADPTGRPLALLSFLLDARNWPADPQSFLHTNFILHLINGLLLAALLRQLGMAMFTNRGHGPDASSTAVLTHTADPGAGADTGRINLAATLAAGLWLLHPLFVSTTLYIVQREAMLPATFVLLGLLAWLHGRQRLFAGHRLSGLVWLVFGLGACTLLGVLSKGNGILLPALALVLEYTAGRAGIRPPGMSGTHKPEIGRRPSLRHSGTAAGGTRKPPQTKGPHETQSAYVDSGPPLRGVRNDGRAWQDVVWRDARLYHRAMLMLAWLPASLVALYLLHAGWSGMVHGISSIRPWTLAQRLLTEPRILMDYLSLLWMPRPFTPGLFNDFIQVSTSPLHPFTTLPALLAVLGLIIGAVLMRRRWPALAAAVLFYFVGQSIESSTIALELYYEHRNYLPALLMFWPLALWLCGLPNSTPAKEGLENNAEAEANPSPPKPSPEGDGYTSRPPTPSQEGSNPKAPSPSRAGVAWGWVSSKNTPISPRFAVNAKCLFAAVLLLGLALMTHARAGLWGNQRDQALLWAQLNPGSPRAQALAGQAEMAAGYPQLAVRRLRRSLVSAPDEPQIAFNLIAAECSLGRIDPATLQATRDSLHSAIKIGALLTHWFERNIDKAANPTCPQMSLDTLTQLLHAVEANPRLMAKSGRRQDIDYLLGRIALARGDGERALKQFNHALDQQVRESAALQQAALLGSHGYPALGLAHLDHYDTIKSREEAPRTGMPLIHAWILKKQNYWPYELKRLRNTLADDAHQKATVTTHP